MKRLALVLVPALFFAIACDDDPECGNNECEEGETATSCPADCAGGNGFPDATVADMGVNGNPDADEDGGMTDDDRGMVDDDRGMVDMDMGVTDLGADGGMVGPLDEEMEAGAYVQVAEGRIYITDGTDMMNPNIDTFATVRQKLGNGTRSMGMNTRSYEWSLSNNVRLTIWFANTNLDTDDPDVDDTDEVLWIAIEGGFMGKTSRQIGIGSTRMMVEALAPTGYGPPPRTTPLDNPPGTLATYFTQGIAVAYDNNDVVRTVTISRAYNVDPNADIKIDDAALDFPIGIVQGFHGFTSGTSKTSVLNVLGYPDGEGQVNNFTVWSYAFIGIELFYFGNQNDVFFLSVHSPYFGFFDNSSEGLGSTRTAVEATLNLGMGVASGSNANLICYPDAMDVDVIVSYSTDMPPVANTVTVGFLTCPN